MCSTEPIAVGAVRSYVVDECARRNAIVKARESALDWAGFGILGAANLRAQDIDGGRSTARSGWREQRIEWQHCDQMVACRVACFKSAQLRITPSQNQDPLTVCAAVLLVTRRAHQRMPGADSNCVPIGKSQCAIFLVQTLTTLTHYRRLGLIRLARRQGSKGSKPRPTPCHRVGPRASGPGAVRWARQTARKE